MKKSDQLKQAKAQKLNALDLLIKLKEGDQARAWTPEEQKSFDDLTADLITIKKQITEAETEESIRAEIAADVMQTPPVPVVHKTGSEINKDAQTLGKRFSLSRAILHAAKGHGIDGAELEMYQEAEREARALGQQIDGQVAIPSTFLNLTNRADDMTVGDATFAGNTVETSLGGFMPILRPKLMTTQLGATALTGLRGNVDMIRQDGKSAGAWEGEIDANALGNPTTAKFSLVPHRYGVTATVSKQLLAQTSYATEAFIRQDLENAIREGVDLAALNGSGSGSEPAGLLQLSINDKALGTDGAVPTFADLIDLETLIAADNADVNTMSYLMTPAMRGLLKSVKKDAGSGEFVFSDNMVNGYNAYVSTQVPSTLTKGASSGICHAIIFGDWTSLIIANWAGIDIVVDPYSTKKTAQLEITINSWWDFNARYLDKFAAIKDALLS